VAFAADDLAAWLIGLLADAGRRKLTGLVLGSDLERALSSAATEAVWRTAEEVCPGNHQKAADVALVVGQVFRAPAPAGSLARGETMLELLRAGVARQMSVLDDAGMTGTGQSSAEVLGTGGVVLARMLTGHLVSAVIVGGSQGGPLFPLANQLNHDLTHLQLRENRAGPSADGQPPVFVTANVSSTLYRSDDWVVDVPLGQLAHWNVSSPPIYKGGLGMWAFAHHLRSVDNNCLHLTVEGRTAQAVVLQQIRFHVLSRRPGSVPRGVRLDLSSLSLGSSMSVRNFEVVLGSADVAVPVPRPLAPYDPELTPDFPYVVHRTGPEQFYFSLDYGDEDIEWVAVLDWLSAGRTGSIGIDDAGAPFASTAFRGRPVYIWNGGRQTWRDHLCADESCYRTHHRSRK
jgi:hypothetical protein